MRSIIVIAVFVVAVEAQQYLRTPKQPLNAAVPFAQQLRAQPKFANEPFAQRFHSPGEFGTTRSQVRGFPYQFNNRRSMQAQAEVQEEGGGPTQAEMWFSVGDRGEEIMGRAYGENEWSSSVRNLNSGQRVGNPFFFLKELGKRKPGEMVSEEDMGTMNQDYGEMQEGDVAAIKRSDGTWRYAKLIKWVEPLAQESWSVLSPIYVVALLGLFLGSIASFTLLRWRRNALTKGSLLA